MSEIKKIGFGENYFRDHRPEEDLSSYTSVLYPESEIDHNVYLREFRPEEDLDDYTEFILPEIENDTWIDDEYGSQAKLNPPTLSRSKDKQAILIGSTILIIAIISMLKNQFRDQDQNISPTITTPQSYILENKIDTTPEPFILPTPDFTIENS